MCKIRKKGDTKMGEKVAKALEKFKEVQEIIKKLMAKVF